MSTTTTEAKALPRRDLMRHPSNVIERECPSCKGDGQHHGPVPYRNCLRCGGFGTIVLYDDVKEER